MKKLFFYIIGFLLLNTTYAQDIILKRNGDEIKAKVQEVGITEIKYKKFDNPDGPMYTILKSEVFLIKYENGTKDVFKAEEPVQPAKNQQVETQQNAQPVPQPKAKLIVYYPNISSLFAYSYDVYADNMFLTKVSYNSYYMTELSPGVHTFSAQSDRQVSISMNMESGNTYCLRCYKTNDILVSIPSLEFVSFATAARENTQIR
jgi:hypothetical protein